MRAHQSCWTAKSGWDSHPAAEKAALVLAFGSPGAISARWAELAARHPHAIVLGCSTGGEIHGCEVMDETLSATALEFAHTSIAAAEADVDTHGGSSFEAGKAIGAQLARSDLASLFVLSDGTRVNGSELVRGLRAAVGDNVVLTGGLAGDGARFGTTYVGLNAPPSPGKIAAIGLYGQRLRVGHGSCGGWDVFGPERVITRAEANVLHELDGQPALDLYKRYLGDDAAGLPGSALLFPLRVYPADRPEEAIVRTVVGVDESARTMIFAGDMPQGYRAQLMRGNFDRLIQGAAAAAEQANRDHEGERVAILVSCIGRKLLLGQRIREEVEAVNDILGGKARLTGFYSYGEVSPHAVTGCAELHNQTMTITVLSEADGA
ncbi:MAG TPA: FIST N-terminal domain-containing protein [Rhizomicrobium sp.]|nr:FIST N-terminal domain-containing protein [Rhizomicrobium sp.]